MAEQSLQFKIEVLGDAAGIENFRASLQNAFNRVNDGAKGVGDRLNQSVEPAGALSGAIRNMAVQAAGLFSVAAAFRFVGDSIKNFAEGERETAKLNATLTFLGGNAEKLRPIIAGLEDEARRFTFTATDADRSLAKYALLLGSVDQAAAATRATMVAAVATGQDYATTEQQILAAMGGRLPTQGLLAAAMKKYADDMSAAGTAGERLNVVLRATNELAPLADASLGTISASTQSLASAWDELKESIGEAINDFVDLPTVLKTAQNAVLGFRTALGLLTPEQEQKLKIAEIGEEIERLKGTLTNIDSISGRAGAALSGAKEKALEGAADQLGLFRDALLDLDPQKLAEAAKRGFGVYADVGTEVAERLTASRAAVLAKIGDLEKQRDSLLNQFRNQRKIETTQAAEENAKIEAANQAKALAEALATREAFLGEVGFLERSEALKRSNAERETLLAALERDKAARLAAAEGNAAEQLRIEQDYAQRALRIRTASAEEQARIIATQIAEQSKKIAELTKLDPAQVPQLAREGRTITDVVKLVDASTGQPFTGEDRLKQLADQYKALVVLVEEFRRAQLAANEALAKPTGTTLAQLADAAARAQQAYNEQLQRSGNLVESGVVSQGEAFRRNIASANQYKAALTDLVAVMLALREATLQADARADVAAIDAALQRIRETIKAVNIEASQFTWTGRVRADLAQLMNDFTDLGRQVSGVLNRSINTAIDGTANALTGLISGAITWREAMRQTALSIINDLIKIAIQYTVGKLAMMAIDKIFHTQSQAQAKQTAAVSGVAGLAKSGEQGGWLGLLLYLAIFAAGIAAVGALAGGFKDGGFIDKGTGETADDVPAWLSRGEAVIPAKSVKQFGRPFIQGIIDGSLAAREFATGGFVAANEYMTGLERPLTSTREGRMLAVSATAEAPTVNVGAAPVNVVVLDDPQRIRRFLESTEGQQVMFDAVRRRKMDLGVLS